MNTYKQISRQGGEAAIETALTAVPNNYRQSGSQPPVPTESVSAPPWEVMTGSDL